MIHALTTFAQDYSYYTTYDASGEGGIGTLSLGFSIFSGLLIIPALIGLWKVFEKAGRPGWKAIIPVYNLIILLQVVGRPVWWILLFVLAFIPYVGWVLGIIIGIILANDMAKSFGKDVAYTVLLFLFPFVGYPVLGFGNAQYKGPAALGAAGGAPHAPGAEKPEQHPHPTGKHDK